MDQVKEILKQLIKYRFWIAVGISTLMCAIAYAVGSGPVQELAKKRTSDIESAQKGVQPFTSGVLPNNQYKPIVDAEKNVLSQDVDASWRKLYDRQKDLLTWPENVEDKFHAWGRKWPETVDPSSVRLAIIDYVTEYPKYVTKVYQSFRPFDPIEGTGVVASPPEAVLLKSAAFKEDTPPELGKVWAAQERLWIQRTLLDVVAEVNKEAKDWDSAIIRQINTLEVGNTLAQDQVSLGKGEALVEAEPITAPGAPAPEESTEAGGAGMARGGAVTQGEVEEVLYIKSPSDQYKILPVHLSVLIDQSRIQDLLIALENSPMTIQVVEFEMSRPGTRVVKPEKGANMNFGGGMMGMAGMMGRGRMGMGMGGPMRGGMMGPMAGYGGMMSQMQSMSRMSMMQGGMMGGGFAPVETRKGVDKRQIDRGANQKKEEDRVASTVFQSVNDPYYYLVDVSVYGQARFYNAPPPPPEASQTEGAPAEEAKKEEPKPEGNDPAAAPADAEKAKAEAPKEGEAAPAKTEEAPKAGETAPAKTEEAPKAEGATPDAKKEEPKAAEPAAKAEGAAETKAAAPGPDTKAAPAPGAPATPKP